MTSHKKKVFAIGIFGILLVSVITIESKASVPNGSFEQWRDGNPVGWKLYKGVTLAEERYRMSGSRSLDLQVDPMDKDPWPDSLMESVPFSLEPNTQYRLSAWVHMIGTSVGDLLFIVATSDGVEVASYRSGWSKNHPWMQISTPFRTRDSKQYRVLIGAESGFGRPVLIDDIRIDKLASSNVQASKADKDRGFTLFTRSVMKSLGIEAMLPSPAEMIDKLNIRLGRGEYEPALLGLYALKDIKDVDVCVAGNLVGPGNDRIDKNDIVIRRLMAEMLPPTRPRSVKANEIIAWWATVKAAKTTAPGVYRGQLQVTVSDKVVHELPLEVEVLDVILPAPDIAFWVYHCEGFFNHEYLTPELRKAYYRDMYEHGMNTVSVYNNADVDGSTNVDFSKDTSYPTAEQDPEFPNDHPMRKYGLDTVVPWILESGLCSAGQPLFYLPSRGDVGDKPGYGWGGVPKDALKATLDGWRDRKWPELVLYCGDEPGSNTGLVPRLKMVKSWFPSIRLTTAGIDPDVLGKHYDVWIQGEAAVNSETLRKSKELGAELWTYNCTAPNTNMPFARAFYGFWAYRTGVKGVAEWAYYDLKGWAADENGDTYGNPGSRHSRVAVSPNGPIPTISWEATREGIDDYRYIQAIRDLSTDAEKLAKKLSAEAEKILTKQDRETIDKRDNQKFSQYNPDAPVITWKASNPEKARGEQIYLVSKLLATEVGFGKQALNTLMEAMPFDAMAPRVRLNYHMPKWANWCPSLGPQGVGDDPVLITEDYRRVLVSYIIGLQDAQRSSEAVLQ